MTQQDAQIRAVLHIHGLSDPAQDGGDRHIADYRFEPNDHLREDGAIDMRTANTSADIFFEVHNHSGVALEFPEDPADCIWIGQGEDCPTGPGDGGGEIRATDRKGDRMSLEVHNANATANRFTYMLRLRQPGTNGSHVLLDPPIVNNGAGGGGGGSN